MIKTVNLEQSSQNETNYAPPPIALYNISNSNSSSINNNQNNSPYTNITSLGINNNNNDNYNTKTCSETTPFEGIYQGLSPKNNNSFNDHIIRELNTKQKIIIIILSLILGISSIIHTILNSKGNHAELSIIFIIDIQITLYSILISFSIARIKWIRYLSSFCSIIFLFLGTGGVTWEIFLSRHTLKSEKNDSPVVILVIIIMSIRIGLFLFIMITLLIVYKVICCKNKNNY